MKIHYVKINSERARRFQLKTIIYEENGQKYVKKQAMNPDAIVHLKKMKENYSKLTNSIIDKHIKLAKIIDESEDSLTFEFINGISLEKRYNLAKKQNKEETNTLIGYYKELLQTGFKTSTFDSKTMVNKTFKTVLGDLDYSRFDGQLCFDSISNIDLIFSNIIFKDDDIYLIDYEWVYDLSIPINFSAFRALHEDDELHWEMEKHFVFQEVVGEYGFLKLANNYTNKRLTLDEQEKYIKDLYTAIDHKDVHIKSQEKNMHSIIHDKDVHIGNQDLQIEHKDMQIKELSMLVEHMRVKNRVKRIIKKVLPSPLIGTIKSIKHKIRPIADLPAASQSIVNNYMYLEPTFNDEVQHTLNSFISKPLISIIMPVYNVNPKWLDLAIKSIERQWYENWELCMVDDKSTDKGTLSYLKAINHSKIKVKFLEKNLNISGASNTALSLTRGEYIALMDNDDELTPNALYEVVKAINDGAEFIYSDEDKIEMNGTFSDPHFKPDFAPDMFLSQNYLSHLGVIKKDLISKVDGFTLGLEGSQDFDLYLKVLEHTEKIHHIDKVLYHWRKIPGSTASEYGEKSYAQDAGRQALENAMQRRNINATVKNGQTPGTFKVDYIIKGDPLVSIIIPYKDKPELLKMCIESILNKSTYHNFEIIGISNNSTEEETFSEMSRLETLDSRIKFYEYNVPFNYSDINNHAVHNYAKGEHLLFLNNDIEIITPSWIEEMLMYSQLKHSGAIGAKLYFPNDTIQHAGIVLAPNTIHAAILMYQGFDKSYYGYISRLKCVNNYSAVTAACLMVKKELFTKINGFDDKNLAIAYNDIDLCLRLQEDGYRNIWTPYCEAYHFESISRGHEVNVVDVERREKEKWHLKNRHPNIFKKKDPYYNHKLTRFGVASELDISATVDYESVQGIPFYEEIIITTKISDKKHNTISIFSHFDDEKEVKEDVKYYLKELSTFSDILFVSTSEELSEDSIKELSKYCTYIILKKNVGYDFGAWKTGLDYLGNDIEEYEDLILCNDSVYGPFYNLEEIYKSMKNSDVCAMSDNHEIEYHLQSYFIRYNRKAFSHSIFKYFWDNFKIYHNKQALIENNEIGFSKQLLDSELSCSAYYQAKNKNYVNVLQYYWNDLVISHNFPFIKKEVLKRNPLQLNIEHWETVIKTHSTYDTNIIKNQLTS